MKNSNDTIGCRTRNFPTCNLVLQPTALLRALKVYIINRNAISTTVYLLCGTKLYISVLRNHQAKKKEIRGSKEVKYKTIYTSLGNVKSCSL
jgi:hypothetical protein